MDHETDDDVVLAAARAEYKEVLGKNPPPRMGLDKLRAKIAEGNADPAAATLPAADLEPAAPPVRMLLLGDHVFLPEDPTSPAWREGETRRYDGKTDGRRTRVTCHPELAAFLQQRGQAEMLDD